MRVLLTSHLFPNRVYPVRGIFVKEQVRFLKERCEVKVIAPIPWFPPLRGFGRWSRFRQIPYRERLDSVDIFHPRYVTFPRRLLFSLVGFFYLVALLRSGRKFDFDLIHAHVAYPDGFAAVLFAKIAHKPVLITAHGSDINLYPRESRIWKALTVWGLSHSDLVIAVSDNLRRRIEEMGSDPKRIRVIYNGVDTELFHPIPKDIAVSRKGLSSELKRIVYVGNLDRGKGIEMLIQAASILAGGRDNFEVVLVGANKRGREDREFMSMAERLGLREQVRFIEAVPITEVPLWIGASDVFVMPSFSEGFPLSVIEALVCGRPVVSTRCGGPEEALNDEMGTLVPPGDPRALADAIGYVLDHPEKYDPESIASYAQERFGLERISGQISDLYASIIKPKKRFSAG